MLIFKKKICAYFWCWTWIIILSFTKIVGINIIISLSSRFWYILFKINIYIFTYLILIIYVTLVTLKRINIVINNMRVNSMIRLVILIIPIDHLPPSTQIILIIDIHLPFLPFLPFLIVLAPIFELWYIPIEFIQNDTGVGKPDANIRNALLIPEWHAPFAMSIASPALQVAQDGEDLAGMPPAGLDRLVLIIVDRIPRDVQLFLFIISPTLNHAI